MRAIETITGRVSVLNRDDIDTDQIIPKQFLKRVERTGFGEFLFYDWAKEPGWDLPKNPILVAGRNFGCGSSREHAPWALEDYGFQAIIAPSFADIFRSNCTKVGLLPVELPPEACESIAAAGEAQVDLAGQEVRWRAPSPDAPFVKSDGEGGWVGTAMFEIDPETKHRLLGGLDDIGLTLAQEDAIAAYESDRERPARSRRHCDRRGRLRTALWCRSMTTPERDWDAATYDRISAPQQAWAREQLKRLQLRGDEVILDAGCGSGKVTALLVDLVTDGHVYAVDVAPSMVEHTRSALAGKVTAYCQDLTELTLPEQVDAIFSNATFHWISDHRKLFLRLFDALKPGGRLVAQCGGAGNIDSFRRLADEIAVTGEFSPYFEGWKGPWYYADAETTADRMRAAGFAEVETWLEARPTLLEDPAPFVRTVCLVRHLDRLPADLHGRFVDAVLERAGTPLLLDYVRLNMVATRPGASD